ncbi:MAG: hypothetical protein ABFQ89_04020 [Chloroflexota bacterium]
MKKPVLTLVGLFLVYALAACFPVTGDEAIVVPTNTPEEKTEIHTADDPVIAAARIELENKLGVSSSDFEATRTATEWPDSSLGCPQPGVVYLTVITPGYIVTFKSPDDIYKVHTDQKGMRVVLCSGPRKLDIVRPSEPEPSFQPTIPDSLVTVYEAALKAVDPSLTSDQVQDLSWAHTTFSSSALGCPQPGGMYLDVMTPGYIFRFRVGETEYQVNTDEAGKSAVICRSPGEQLPSS